MSQTQEHEQTTAETLTAEQIQSYRNNGFVRVRGIISPEEAEHFRQAALNYSAHGTTLQNDGIFQQMVNVWQENSGLKPLTLHPNVAAVAEKLAGVSLRLWHDQILIKPPLKSKPTEFHQDQPYWPHANSPHPISCWIALCDVPAERGCMSFIPGSHNYTDLEAQNLTEAGSLFGLCPELQWEERVTVPLRAGDCTFHHGRCAHMATPNFTDEARVAHVVIFIDEDTIFTGAGHPVTQTMDLKPGEILEGELFPSVEKFAEIRGQ